MIRFMLIKERRWYWLLYLVYRMRRRCRH